MQRHAGPPAVRQRRHGGVAVDDPVQVRRAEQGQHGQVRLPVTAVRGRVDEPRAVAGPDEVARPAVTVDAAGRLSRAGDLPDPAGHRLDGLDIAGPQGPGVRGSPQEGQDPAFGVPSGPAAGRRPGPVVQGEAGDEPGPRGAEALSARAVCPGQLPPEPFRRVRGAPPGRDPGQDQGPLIPAEHPGNGRAGRIAQPAQAAGLSLERRALITGGHLGERLAAVVQGDPDVPDPVLGPCVVQVPDAGSRQPGDPAGEVSPATVRSGHRFSFS